MTDNHDSSQVRSAVLCKLKCEQILENKTCGRRQDWCFSPTVNPKRTMWEMAQADHLGIYTGHGTEQSCHLYNLLLLVLSQQKERQIAVE